MIISNNGSVDYGRTPFKLTYKVHAMIPIVVEEPILRVIFQVASERRNKSFQQSQGDGIHPREGIKTRNREKIQCHDDSSQI